MVKGINLISLEGRKTIQFVRLKKKAKSLALAAAALFVGLSFLVLLAFFWLNQNYKANATKISGLEGEIKSFERTESYAVTIANRVKGVNKILVEREAYLGLLEDLEVLSVPGFMVEGLELSPKGDLKITGSCQDNRALTTLNQEVEKLIEKKKYKNIVFPSVSLGNNGQYKVALELEK